jgi:two-component system, sensor histidine kinase SagS
MQRWGDCLVVIIRDISAAKRLQQKINAIDLAGSELVRFDADVVRRYNAHERLKLLETKIVRVARDLLHFDHFAIRLLDDRSGKLELVIGYSLPPDFDSFLIKPSLEGHGISGHVAASGRSYICPDTTRDDLYLPGVEGARSSLTVPLRLHDKVIGIMNVESLRPGAFSEEDRQLGEIFARYVAVAINMLDLLVVERSTTNQSISGRVAVELNEPLQDIAHEVEVLQGEMGHAGPSTTSHLDRIRRDLESIRSRIKDCAAGPASLLGVEQALADKSTDPLLSGKRVLVADDEQRIRRIIGDVLTNRGCSVVVCKDGAEAMEALKTAGAGGFDLIVSDIRMPDHNGYEIFASSHKFNPKAPVILMTGFGYDPHHSIVRASQEGLQSVLFKPFQVERLLDEVRKALVKAS